MKGRFGATSQERIMIIVDRVTFQPVTKLECGQEVYLKSVDDDLFPYIVTDQKWLASQSGSVGATIEGPDADGHYHSSCFIDLRKIKLMDFS